MLKFKSIVKNVVIPSIILISVVFSLGLFPFMQVQAASGNNSSRGPASTVSKLHVEGSSIVDGSGNPVQLRGFCCGSSTRIDRYWPTWYTDQTFKTVTSWGANLFRITLKPEQYEWRNEYVNTISNYADMAIANGMYVLFTWMGNEDFTNYEDSAVDFFDALSKRYSGCNNVLYEIANEPFHNSWDTLYAYGEKVIPVIKANSPDAIIGIPAPYQITSGDDNMTAVISKPLPYDNVVYTHHMYVASSFSSTALREIEEFLNNGLPVFISEWGTTESNGQDGFDEERSKSWLTFLDSHGISWVNFNLSDVYWNNINYNSSVVKMGQWNPALNDEILSESGYFMKHYFLEGLQAGSGGVAEVMGASRGYAFWDDSIKSRVTKIVFAESGFRPQNVKNEWDCSVVTGTKDVMAYLCEEGSDVVVYITANNDGELTAPLSMKGFFEGFSSLKEVDFSGIDTSNTTNVSRMFFNCKKLEDIEWGEDPFNNVANWSQSFACCQGFTDLDLTELDLENASNINLMFSWCDHLETLSLPYLYEDNINEDVDVFYKCSINSDSLLVKVYDDNGMYVSDLLENSTAVNDDYALQNAYKVSDLPEEKQALISDTQSTGDGTGEIMEASSGYAFWTDECKDTVTRVVFEDSGEAPDSYKKIWDCSSDSDSKDVMAYLCDEGPDKTVYITSTDGVIAPESLSSYFDGFKQLRTVDMSGLDTAETVDASKLFYGCNSLEYVDWGDNQFENVKNWSQAFGVCKNLSELDLTSFDMGNTTNINLMFSWCANMEYLGLPHLTPENLRAITDVFYKCGINVDELMIQGLEHNNEFIYALLNNSTGVNQSISLKNAVKTDDTVVDNSMLVPLEDVSLETLAVDKDTSVAVVDANVTVDDLKELEEEATTSADVETTSEEVAEPIKVSTDMMKVSNGYAFWDNAVKSTITQVVFSDNGFVPNEADLEWDISAEEDAGGVMAYLCNEGSDKTLYISSEGGEIIAPDSMSGFFDGFKKLNYVDFAGLDASETTNISKLFNGCSSLEAVDFGKNKFENVKNWSQLFSGCTGLTELDMSELDMKNANNINLMFCWCNHLENLNLPYLEQKELSSVADVFYKAGKNANSLDLDVYKENRKFVKELIEHSTDPNSNYSVNNKGRYKPLSESEGLPMITEASNGNAFWQDEFRNVITKAVFCNDGFFPDDSVEEWDVSAEVDSERVMAFLCDEDGDMTLYITSEDEEIIAPESLAGFFEGFKALRFVDFSGLVASDTTNLSKIFSNCQRLEEIDFGSNSFDNSMNWSQAFAVCKSLTDLDLSGIDMSNTRNINLMFSWCDHLENLKLPYLDEDSINSSTDVFYKCAINVGSWEIEPSPDNCEFVKTLIDNSTSPNPSYEILGFEEEIPEEEIIEEENETEVEVESEITEEEEETESEVIIEETESEEDIVDIEEDDTPLSEKPYEENPAIPIAVVMLFIAALVLANKPEYLKKLISSIRNRR
ncbi:cellulase family glycosylhydrolase [Butyrivibrio sp. VCB2001]|uniref:cellulase family glycosylhydrolase n=1 Tax=Butyrivibrio sp. VCB2001 TaxID=1280667 RepID=UPI00042169D2|nr:cellulase family glycosylhydrolase [Butyrivibrio sp. VCB2001]